MIRAFDRLRREDGKFEARLDSTVSLCVVKFTPHMCAFQWASWPCQLLQTLLDVSFLSFFFLTQRSFSPFLTAELVPSSRMQQTLTHFPLTGVPLLDILYSHVAARRYFVQSLSIRVT